MTENNHNEFSQFKELGIINGYLVARGVHELDYPAGAAYGPVPNSDAEPLVKLSDLPGWPIPRSPQELAAFIDRRYDDYAPMYNKEGQIDTSNLAEDIIKYLNGEVSE